jgi:hypothetical protein
VTCWFQRNAIPLAAVAGTALLELYVLVDVVT